eukprot:Rhum_TRINITY_DN1154_c0_g1::Rhum_TRINITY_DN1154_c0_g1_i1::g.3281::m.3281
MSALRSPSLRAAASPGRSRSIDFSKAVTSAGDPLTALRRFAARSKKCGRPGDANVVVFSAAMAACARRGLYDDVWAARKMMDEPEYVQCGVVPNVFTYNSLLVACTDVHMVADVLREMAASDVAPSRHTYTTVLRLLVAFGEKDAALQAYRGMIHTDWHPDDASTAFAVAACPSAAAAARLVEENLLKRGRPDQVTSRGTAALYKVAVSAEDIEGADVFRAQYCHGKHFDEPSFIARLGAYARCGMHRHVIVAWGVVAKREEAPDYGGGGGDEHEASVARRAPVLEAAAAYLSSLAGVLVGPGGEVPDGAAASLALYEGSAYWQGLPAAAEAAASPDARNTLSLEAFVGRVARHFEEAYWRGAGAAGAEAFALSLLQCYAAAGDAARAREFVRLLPSQTVTAAHLRLAAEAYINGGRYWLFDPPPRAAEQCEGVVRVGAEWGAGDGATEDDLEEVVTAHALSRCRSLRRRLLHVRNPCA